MQFHFNRERVYDPPNSYYKATGYKKVVFRISFIVSPISFVMRSTDTKIYSSRVSCQSHVISWRVIFVRLKATSRFHQIETISSDCQNLKPLKPPYSFKLQIR